MATYGVYLPPLGMTGNSVDGFRLLRDGKSVFALVVPLIWLIWHRLWLPLMVYLLASAAILALFMASTHVSVAVLSLLPGFYLFLEGPELLRAKLERAGWRYATVVEAQNEEEAELRFLKSTGAATTYKSQSPHRSRVTAIPARPARPDVPAGIFPE